ncbi:hypothetical protein [Streptomyces sp. NBC_00503]|uniref:hypothetical protein n=1 Tax=Streptomyces sp. NBC_00503 TaxID=2903659 RepID=UPI002E8189CC|nr:hypothetical protein [Streptomyces sp. NBC_00503]WUD80048.1 hypothetical protein OG490_05430 [Streptomyces sp. NBC_00503]
MAVALGVVLDVAVVLVRARMEIREDVLAIRNFWSWKLIPLVDITDVSGVYYGMDIGVRGSGGNAFSIVCQKSNMARWFRRRVRADRIADAVMAAAERARAAKC